MFWRRYRLVLRRKCDIRCVGINRWRTLKSTILDKTITAQHLYQILWKSFHLFSSLKWSPMDIPHFVKICTAIIWLLKVQTMTTRWWRHQKRHCACVEDHSNGVVIFQIHDFEHPSLWITEFKKLRSTCLETGLCAKFHENPISRFRLTAWQKK